MTHDSDLTDNVIQTIDVKDQISILNLNKSYGHDNISPKFTKAGIDDLAEPLAKIFNKSLILGIYPLSWKKANVIPLFKKGNMALCENYRPVSLLSMKSKIFEKNYI